jgi:hypothetical protein
MGVNENVHFVPIHLGVSTAREAFGSTAVPDTSTRPNISVGTPYLSLSKIEKLHEDPEVAALMQAPLTNDVDASRGPEMMVKFIGLDDGDSLWYRRATGDLLTLLPCHDSFAPCTTSVPDGCLYSITTS